MTATRFVAVVVKETREILRDPITLGVAILMPLVMLFLFGYAITLDVDDISIGVLDQDRSVASRELVARFTGSGYFRLVDTFLAAHEVEASLQRNDIKLSIIIPSGFESAIARADTTAIQVLVDGTYSATANLITAYAQAIASEYPYPVPHKIEVETRVWYNPSLKSVTYVIPGLFGVILLAFPPLLTALAITREKEFGSIQQIFASSLTASEFLAGKLVPYGLIAFLQLTLVILVGFLWFEIPLRGSLALLFAVGLIYALCTVGIGLLVSTITRSQLVAMLLALIVTLMPSFLFSGFLFPIFTMPYLLQLYTRIFPGRYFVDFSRAVVLKGAALPEVWGSAALLLLYTAVIFGLAVWRFRRKVA